MEILGIHIDPPFVRTALIRKGRQGIEVSKLEDFSHDSHEPGPLNVKPLYTEKFKGRIVSGLSSKHFLIRSTSVKVGKSRYAEEAIAFQSEATSHFKTEQMLTVPLLQRKDKGVTDALLFLVEREGLKQHLIDFQKIQVDPDAITAIPLALCHFAKWKFPELKEAILVDFGSKEINCALVENGELKKAHHISEGIDEWLAAFLEDRKKILLKKEVDGAAKQFDLLTLKQPFNPHLSQKLNEVRQELAKTFYSFARESKKEVIVTGRTDAFIHLKEFLLEDFGKYPLSPEEEKFAISIGLALEQASKNPLQLRREEFFPQKNWNRMGFYALSLLTFSIILSGLLFGLGIHSSKVRKTEMLQSFRISTDGNIEEKIDEWISGIEKTNKEYPYIVLAPKVAEVLSWVSTHPLLEELKGEGDPIDIREIGYQLVSSPRAGSTKEPYLAKVEIEFRFQNAMNARRFHEALREGDALVNPHLEISWDALNEGYRATFFLNNRSRDVP